MATLLLWTMLVAMPQDQPADKVEATNAAAPASTLDPETKKKRETARRQLAMLWALLALMSILFVALGGIWLIVRQGRRLRRLPKAKRTKYFDLTVPTEKPPTEPAAPTKPDQPADGTT